MIFKRKNNAEKLDLLMLPDYPEVLQPYRISFRLGENKSESAKLYWNECLDQLKKLHQEQVSSEILVKLLSMNIDDLITTLFERADWLFQESHPSKSRKCALIALGGYGRSEMHPHSDVDLLFVYSSKEKPEEYLNAISDAILYVLWDLKLDLGNITRSIQESRLLFKEDVVSVSSMLDARYLAGDKNIAQDFLQMIQEEIQTKSARDFFDQEKSKENRDRRKKFGSSVYIIEPNVKESEGGLRDVQTLLWYAHVFQQKKTLETLLESKWLTEESYQELKVGRNFLWQVRNAIHFHLDQKKDQLTFPLQEKISKELGYEDEPGILAVEKFMQTYYHHAANIKRIVDLSVDEMVHKTEKKLKLIVPKGAESFDSDFVILGEKLLAKDPLCFEKNPFNLMRVFLVAQKENVDLGEETRRLISKNLHLADEDFASHPEVNRMIRDLFTELKGLGRVLNLMHELKMLHRVIPEFGEVLYRPQHDVYHIYTVDNHSIFAVGELSKLFEGTYDNTFSYFKEVLFQTPRHDLLSLGTFFHDVGKGRGKNHSIVGAEMALRATQRMGFSDKDCEMVEFLVKSHLLMPHLSQRRDLDDPNLIIQFARSMQDIETLNMLFLLTWADIRAVGPDVWTPWKGSLLTELHKRTRTILESGDFTRAALDRKIEEVKSQVTQLLGTDLTEEERESFLKNMPPKYFLSQTPEEIVRHLKLISHAGSDQMMMDVSVSATENVNELLLYTLGTPGLLAKTAGTMTANDLNILEAKQSVSKNGQALVHFIFTDAQGKVIQEERRLQNLKKDLLDLLENRVRVSQLIESRKKPIWMQKKLARTFPAKVEIDNDVSAYYTVIDIYAHDRIGLLYEILTTLSNLGLYVDVSKISTKVDQAADVFYVKDIFGQKVTQSEKIKRIRAELLKSVEGEV